MLTICNCISDEDNNVTNEDNGSSDDDIEAGSQNIRPSRSKDILTSKSTKKIERDVENYKKLKDDHKEEKIISDERFTNSPNSKEKERKERSKSTDKRKPTKKKSKGYRILYKREKLKRNFINRYIFQPSY